MQVNDGQGADCFKSFVSGSCADPHSCSCASDCLEQGTCCFDLCATEARATSHEACWQGDCKTRQENKEPVFFQDIDTELEIPNLDNIPVFVRNATLNASCNSPTVGPNKDLPDEGGTAGGAGAAMCSENIYNPSLPPTWPTSLGDIEALALVPAGTHTFHATGQAKIRPTKLLRDVLKASGEEAGDTKVAQATLDLAGDGVLAFSCDGGDCEFRLSRFVLSADSGSLDVKPPLKHEAELEFARMYVGDLALVGNKSGNKVTFLVPDRQLFAPVQTTGSFEIDSMAFRGERLTLTRNDTPSTITIKDDQVDFDLVFTDQWFTVDVDLSAPLVAM